MKTGFHHTLFPSRAGIGDSSSSFPWGKQAQILAQDQSAPEAKSYDVVVYGGTSAGVIAAVQAKKMGKSAIIVCPDRHLGGLSSGGLGFTDTGNKAVIGGLSREFYHRIWKHYQTDEAWTWQDRADYGNKGQGTPAIDGAAANHVDLRAARRRRRV